MALLAFLLPSALLFIAIYLLFFKKKAGNYAPGPRPWPIIGNLLQVKSPELTHVTFTNMAKKYGPIFSIQLGLLPGVVISDPQIIREAFSDPVFQGRPPSKVFKAVSGGDYGVLGVDGTAKWADQRRFTLKHLKDFGFGKKQMESLILDEARELVENFKAEEGKPINPARRFNLAVLNSLWIIVTGQRINQDDPVMNYILEEYFVQLSEMFVTGVVSFIPPIANIAPERSGWNAYLKAIEKTTGVFKRIIAEHKEVLNVDTEPKDYIDAYLQEVEKTKDPNSSFFKENGYKNLLAIVGDLFAAGGETTSTTLNWAVLYLASHPEVQKKLQAEIDQVLGHRLPSLADKPQMPYTEATMQEILRYSSIAAISLFHTALQDTKLRGFDIPKGTHIIPNFHFGHFDPKVWGDPEKFRPDRFLKEDGKTIIKNEALIPFSVGKRVCLGEALARDEFFIFLTCLFQRFDIELDQTQGKASLKAVKAFILTPEPYKIIVHDRYSS